MCSTWKTEEDFERDLWEFSEYNCNFDDFEPTPPNTLLEHREKMLEQRSVGIFDTPVSATSEDEDKVMFYGGRGRMKRIVIKPGQKPSYNEDELIQNKIREVNGIGYSNDYIQDIYKLKTKNNSLSEKADNSSLEASSSSSSSSPIRMSTKNKLSEKNSGRTSNVEKLSKQWRREKESENIDLTSEEDFPSLN